MNLVNPQTGVAPYPAFGPVSWRGDVGNSTFHALQLNARRAFQNGFLLSANYMWSHSINDGSIGGGESDTPQDSFCRACDKATSDDDVRQVFNLSAVYQLPFGAGQALSQQPRHGADGIRRLDAERHRNRANRASVQHHHRSRPMASVPGGFAISGEERPNYLSGVSLTPPGGSTPQGMGKSGGLFHACFRNVRQSGPQRFSRAAAFRNWISRWRKMSRLAERMKLRFRADVFNVFNRAQYGAPNADLSQANFGVITTTISSYATGRGTPREFQLSAQDIVLGSGSIAKVTKAASPRSGYSGVLITHTRRFRRARK